MSTDRTVGDTFYIAFTTRSFTTGVPATLAGTPVVSAYENADLTQITAGITLGIDHDGVTGLNMLTLVATGGNGYETLKDYQLIITTGTVGGVSVVGEVVGQFSLSLSAAAKDLTNGTDGLGAIKTDTAAILVDTETTIPGQITALNDVAATDIVSSGAITTSGGAVSNVTTVATTTTNTDMRGTDSANTTTPPTTVQISDAVWDEAQSGHTTAGTFGKFLDVEVSSVSGGGGLTSQDVRDAMKLTPTGGAPSSGSVDEHLDDILTDTGTTIPAQITGLNDVAATDIVTAGAITTLTGAIVNVDLVDSCTTNADMRGTDSALLAADIDLTSGAVDTVTTVTNRVTANTDQIASDATAATNLSKSAIGIEPGAAIAGTLSVTQMTTDLTETTDDHYNGRIIVWTTGALKNQATDITDYTGSTKLLTFTATTEAPVATDEFVII